MSQPGRPSRDRLPLVETRANLMSQLVGVTGLELVSACVPLLLSGSKDALVAMLMAGLTRIRDMDRFASCHIHSDDAIVANLGVVAVKDALEAVLSRGVLGLAGGACGSGVAAASSTL